VALPAVYRVQAVQGISQFNSLHDCLDYEGAEHHFIVLKNAKVG
jgi:hypothetical protein